jgi:hypothetical protein
VQGAGVERRVAGPGADRGPAAARDRAHVDAECAHLVDHRVADAPQVLEVGARADVHVQPDQVEPVLLDVAQRLVEIGVPDAVLAPLAARVRLAAVPVSEARVHAQPHAVARAMPPELLEHVGRARVDGDVELDNARERGFVDQVGRVDEARGLAAPLVARARALDLAERHRVDERPAPRNTRSTCTFRARLLRIAHHVERAQVRELLADRVGVVQVVGVPCCSASSYSRAVSVDRIRAIVSEPLQKADLPPCVTCCSSAPIRPKIWRSMTTR